MQIRNGPHIQQESCTNWSDLTHKSQQWLYLSSYLWMMISTLCAIGGCLLFLIVFLFFAGPSSRKRLTFVLDSWKCQWESWKDYLVAFLNSSGYGYLMPQNTIYGGKITLTHPITVYKNCAQVLCGSCWESYVHYMLSVFFCLVIFILSFLYPYPML